MKPFFVLILFFINSTLLLSQPTDTIQLRFNQPFLFLKTNCRAAFLQPAVSVECFYRKLSLEVGAGYFWTGRKCYGDDLGDRMGYFLLSIGPSKGYDLFTEMKLNFSSGWYAGVGYQYRYSHYNEKKFYEEVAQYQYQKYFQTERATANLLRLSFGGRIKSKWKLIYFNPYLATSIGYANLIVKIEPDAPGPIKPLETTSRELKVFWEMGFNICFKMDSN